MKSSYHFTIPEQLSYMANKFCFRQSDGSWLDNKNKLLRIIKSNRKKNMEEPANINRVALNLKSSLPICRVCLDICMEYIEFEGALCVVNGQEVTYSEGLNEILSPTLELPKKLPTNFCVTCGRDLLNAYLFIKRVENANFILNKVHCFNKECKKNVDCKDEECRVDSEFENNEDDFKEEVNTDFLATEFINCEANHQNINYSEEILKIENEDDVTQPQNLKSIEFEVDPDSPTTPEHVDTVMELEEITYDTNYSYNEEPVLMCDKCEEVCETKHTLTEHRKKHKSKENTKVKCINCDKVFSTSKQLDDHLLFHKYSQLVTVNSDKILNGCSICKKNYRTEAEFIDHLNVHRGSRPHVCNLCSNAFYTKQHLQLHKWRAHANQDSKKRKSKDFEKCQHCQRLVKKSLIEKHMESHSAATKQFNCPVCERKFATKFGLKAHSAAHKKREFVCPICDKTCLTTFTLKKHMHFMHLSDRKKYQCEDCGLVFQYPSYLKDHQRKHNIKNRFQCPHCDRSYCRKPQLEIHLRYHNNDFRFKCDQCDKCYVTKSNLNDHIRASHTKVTYNCDKCDVKFKSITGLRKHKYTHTGYPYICPLCSAGHTSRSGMKAHLFGVHKDAITEEEFNEIFPIVNPKSGYRRPKA